MTTTTMDQDYSLSRYPIAVSIDAPAGDRNRLTTVLRPILAIPHTILVGPGAWLHRLDSAGLIGAAAYVLAIVNWFAILVAGESIKGIRDFQLYYLRWRTRAVAYMALFVDPYPPFGDGRCSFSSSHGCSAPSSRGSRFCLPVPTPRRCTRLQQESCAGRCASKRICFSSSTSIRRSHSSDCACRKDRSAC